jgi:uncharacterized membrane protein YesL
MLGVHNVANRIANYKRVDNSYFWEGARQHIGRGWLLYLAVLVVPVMIGFNIWFYAETEGIMRTFSIFWAWIFLFILMVGQYVFPLFWQQDEPSFWLVLRNAAVLTLRHPLYSFLMLLFHLLVLTLSVALTLPLLLLMPGMLALSGNFALVGLLQDMGLAPQPPQPTRR